MNVSHEKKEEFEHEIATEPQMKALIESILDVWPEDIHSVPRPLWEHHPHRASLSVEDALILTREVLVIQLKLCERVLKISHKFHLGISQTTLPARNIEF